MLCCSHFVMISVVPLSFLYLGLPFAEWGNALQFMNVTGRDCEMSKCCVNEGEIVLSVDTWWTR